jgi:hypothetical protein
LSKKSLQVRRLCPLDEVMVEASLMGEVAVHFPSMAGQASEEHPVPALLSSQSPGQLAGVPVR